MPLLAKPVIPYGRQNISEADIDAVVEVLGSDFLTTGPVIGEFESRFAYIVDAQHAVAVSNGTTALHLVSEALGLGAGSKIIVPSIFLASANAQVMAGYQVVFADVSPTTGLLTPETLQEAINRAPDAKAAVVVHLNGLAADMPGLAKVAKANGIQLIEDACHALGSAYPHSDGTIEKVGSCKYSSAAAFSFHPVKTIATGEGGMITCNNSNLRDRVSLLRSHGMSLVPMTDKSEALDPVDVSLPWKYEMRELGWNYRLSAIQAALGISQLSKLTEFLDKRLEIVKRYNQSFELLSKKLLPVAIVAENQGSLNRTGWHLYPVLVRDGSQARLDLFNWLVAQGIRPQVHYYPLHRQPFYKSQGEELSLPGADKYYSQVLSLPLYTGLTDAQQEHVIRSILNFHHFSPQNQNA